jgi:low affinity Fe/Cu permease
MFPLETRGFLENAAALHNALEESIRRVVTARSGIVSLEGKSCPELEAFPLGIWTRSRPLVESDTPVVMKS